MNTKEKLKKWFECEYFDIDDAEKIFEFNIQCLNDAKRTITIQLNIG
jgi:hypothetical protein